MKPNKAELIQSLTALFDDGDVSVDKAMALVDRVLGTSEREHARSFNMIEGILARQDVKDRAMLNMMGRMEQTLAHQQATIIALASTSTTAAPAVLQTARAHAPAPRVNDMPLPDSPQTMPAGEPIPTHPGQPLSTSEEEFVEREVFGSGTRPPNLG